MERLFFLKMVVPTPWNGRLGCFKTKRACPNGHALSVSVIKNVCCCLFVSELHPFFYGLHVEGDEAVMAFGERLIERFL